MGSSYSHSFDSPKVCQSSSLVVNRIIGRLDDHSNRILETKLFLKALSYKIARTRTILKVAPHGMDEQTTSSLASRLLPYSRFLGSLARERLVVEAISTATSMLTLHFWASLPSE
jgi:hypothetical protein